jgi:predicted metal-dependent peptidase
VGTSSDDVACVIDDHGIWREALQDAESARRAVADLVQGAAVEAGGLPEELQEALCAGVGSAAGDGVYVLRGDRSGELDWRRLLRRYAGEVLQPRPAYHRPPRRFPGLVGILPGRYRAGDRPAVLAVIDTSGSICDESLEEIDGELRRLARSHPVHVVECDCAVHRTYPYRGRLEYVTGRGGTDFRPPLEPPLLRRLRAELVIYFTDGEGPAPEEPPPVPLIWCLVPGGEPPAPWGRVVRMDPGRAEWRPE